ncbi:MAG: YtxH domain-containing protein [Coriobacteriia bacterium]|nr:YtxH domain-containing protein [Coriobacteriia bacterium]
MSKSGSLSTFILGGLVGAALGVLFAPRPGYESREILVDRALDYWDNADGIYDAASDRAVEIYATSRDVALDATEQVRTKIETARARLLEEVEAVADKVETEKDALEAKIPEAVEVGVVVEKPAPAKAEAKKVAPKAEPSEGTA